MAKKAPTPAADVIVERSALLPALERTAPLADRKATSVIMSHVLIEAEDGRLSITASDLDMWARAKMPAEISAPLTCAVAGQVLRDIVKKMPEGAQISITRTHDARDSVRIAAGRARFTLQTLPASDFPTLPPMESPASFEMAATELADMISRVDFAIANDETRFYLNGIYLHVEEIAAGRVLRTVATNGHRLARYQRNLPEGAQDMPAVIIPREMVKEIAGLTKAADGKRLTLEVSAGRISVSSDTVSIASKVIDHEYPDYRQVLPVATDRQVVANREEMMQAAARVAAVSTAKGHAMRLDFSAGGIELRVRETIGEAEDGMEAEFEGLPIVIGFSSKYLLDTLGAITSDRVIIEMADPLTAAVFRPEGDDAALYVIMPMRV